MKSTKTAERRRDDTVASAPKLAEPVEPSTDFAKPVFLVGAAEQPAYSVFKVDAAAVAGGNEPRRARTLAGLPDAEHGMSFVTVHSQHGNWIVGVGGRRTIIYDPRTPGTLRGPGLSPKEDPILISHGGKMDDIDAILTACQTESAKAKDFHGAVQVKQESQVYKFKGGSRFVASLGMPVVAALSMDMTG